MQIAKPNALWNVASYGENIMSSCCSFGSYLSATSSQLVQTEVVTEPMPALWVVNLLSAPNRSLLNTNSAGHHSVED